MAEAVAAEAAADGGGGGGGGGSFVGSSGFGGGCACSGSTCQGPTSASGYGLTVEVQYVDDTPELLELVIPVQAKWLKEFYNVDMAVTNLGSAGFTLTGGEAQLDLPTASDGSSPLALPALNGQAQPALQTMPDIPGGDTQSVQWIVRGDEEGDWYLSASYTATLQPVGVPVQLDATLTTPIHVWGLSAISLQVTADDSSLLANPYDVTVSITNDTNTDPSDEIPLYNVGLQLLTQGALNFVYQPNQQMAAESAELDPGQTLSLPAVLIPDFTGDLRPDLSSITEKEAGGLTDTNSTIIGQTVTGGRLTASGQGITDGVQLDWQPVPDATGYQIWSTAAWPNPIPNPPDLTLTQFSGSPLLTVGEVTQADVTGLTPGATASYAVVPLFGGTPGDMQNELVQATAGAVATNCNPPAITSADSATAIAGTPFNFVVTTCSTSVPIIKGSGLPKGLSLVNKGNGTATISGNAWCSRFGQLHGDHHCLGQEPASCHSEAPSDGG